MKDPGSMLGIAERMFSALERGDTAALLEIYAADATVWSSATGRTTALVDVVTALPALARRVPDRRYENRRVIPFEDGFVQRHRLTGTRRDGARVAVECCLVACVSAGRVTRCEEYVDARQLEAFFA